MLEEFRGRVRSHGVSLGLHALERASRAGPHFVDARLHAGMQQRYLRIAAAIGGNSRSSNRAPVRTNTADKRRTGVHADGVRSGERKEHLRERKTWSMNVRRVVVLVAVGSIGLMGALVVGRSWAAGIPTTGALTYSGVLEDATGVPFSGTINIEVYMWGTPMVGATPLCRTQANAVNLNAGRFSVELPDNCATAIQEHKDVWVEVRVEETSLGLTKIGAVPFALESGHATSADTASTATSATTASAAAGGLATSITSLTTRIQSLESRVTVTTGGTLTIATVFAKAGDEFYDSCRATFSANQCGVMAHRLCRLRGYLSGWMVGEDSDGTMLTVDCIK